MFFAEMLLIAFGFLPLVTVVGFGAPIFVRSYRSIALWVIGAVFVNLAALWWLGKFGTAFFWTELLYAIRTCVEDLAVFLTAGVLLRLLIIRYAAEPRPPVYEMPGELLDLLDPRHPFNHEGDRYPR